jgi:hypothetical protein
MDQQVLDSIVKYGAEVFAAVAFYIAISLMRATRDWAKAKHNETLAGIMETSEKYLRQRTLVAVGAVEQMAKTDETLNGPAKLDLALGILYGENINADRHDVENAVRQMKLWDMPEGSGTPS